MLTELPASGNNPSSVHPVVQDALEWIMHNLDVSFTVTELAEILHTGQSQLSRLFRHHLNCTVTGYIRQLRVQKSRMLLAQTTLPIKEVAARVGIFDSQYFNKIIRSETGMSPTQFRSSQTK